MAEPIIENNNVLPQLYLNKKFSYIECDHNQNKMTLEKPTNNFNDSIVNNSLHNIKCKEINEKYHENLLIFYNFYYKSKQRTMSNLTRIHFYN